MAGKKIGIVLALDGEREFSQGMANAKKESALLNSELKKLSTEYTGNANSLEFLAKKQENLTKQTQSYQKQADAAKKGLENAQNTSQKAAKRYEELSKALKEAEKAQENMQKSGKEGTKEYQDQSKKIEELQKALEKQGSECQKCEGKISTWTKKVNDAETGIEKSNQALKKNEKYMKEAQDATDNCATSIDKFGKEAKGVGEAGEVFTGLGEKISNAIVTKGIAIAADAVGALKDKAIEAAQYAVEVGSSFEAGMSEVAAISGASGSELEALTDKAKELGSTTKFSATEAASAMTNMSLAGWTVDQTLSGIDGVMQLAAASGMDLADASQIVTDNISSFGLAASDATNIADMMAYAQANSSTTAAELGEAYKNCGANMNAAGQDIETTTSMLEALANNGLRGSEAGTALAAVMRDMTSKMKDGKIAIGDTSVEVMDSNGNFRDMTDILKDVEDATDGMGDAQKQAALMSTFTSDSIKGLNMLLSTGSDQVTGYEENLRNCSGAASDMAETMQDNLQGKLTELSSATEGLGIAAYNYISGPLQGGVELLTGLISGLTDIITPQKEEIDTAYTEIMDSTQQLKDNMASIDDQFTGTMDSADRVGQLAERLEELNGVENRTAVQKQEMAAIVNELSQSIPELSGAYDTENDKLAVTNTQLEKLVKNYQQTAVQQAVIAATQELVNQKLEAQVLVDQASEQKKSVEARMKLLQDELDLINEVKEHENDINIALQKGLEFDADSVIDYQTEALKIYKKALDDGVISLEEYQMAEKAISNDQMGNRFEVLTGTITQSGEATGILATSIEDLSDKAEDYGKTIEDNKNRIAECDSQTEKYAEASENIFGPQEEGAENASAATGLLIAQQGILVDSTKEVNEAFEESSDAADATKDAMQQIMDSYTSTMESIQADLENKINFADKFDGGADITTEEINSNLQSQIDGLTQYQQNLQRVREMTDENGQAIFSPEVMQKIESQGTDMANILQHIVKTWDEQSNGVEEVKGIADKYAEALDLTEEIAQVGAANQTAYELAMGELGSSEVDFSGLRESVDNAVSSAAEGWAELPEETRTLLDQTIQTAQECGIQIPEGLAEGIASGEVSPQQALDQLNGTIEGTAQGLAEIAKESGMQIPEEIQAGIDAGGTQAVTAMQQLLALIQEQAADAQSAGEDVGTAVGEGTKASIENQQSDVEKAGGNMASAAAKAAEDKKSEYEKAGSTSAQQYQAGINSGKSGAISSAGTMASQAAAAVRAYQNAFYSAGYNAADGVASGIEAGRSRVISTSNSVALSALNAFKAALQIHSPSKRFQNEVGKMIPAGVAQGITGNAKVAVTASVKMSQAVLKNATSWLAKYNKSHAISIENEKWYWQQVKAQAVKGSTEYKKAVKELTKLDSATTITSALSSSIKNNFGVSKKKTSGSGDNKKTTTKDKQTYNSEILTAAEKRLDNYKTLHATTLEQEKNYWQNVRKHLKSGTTAWYEATKKIQELDTQIIEEKEQKQQEAAKNQATVQSKLLDTYKTYYKMSEKAEMQYWNIARQQFQTGTDERIEADQKYLEAKEKYEKDRLELDKDYKEKEEKLEKELAENIKELQEKQQNAVADRKKDILSSMQGYDAWDASGYTADTLIHNMQTQVEGLKLWESQLQELSGKGLSDGLLQELKDAGPEAAANIYSLNKMTADQLDEFNKLWEEKQNIAQRQAEKDTKATWDSIDQQIQELKNAEKKELEDLQQEYDKAIADLDAGLSTGLESLVKQAGSIGEDIVGNLIAGIQRAGTAGIPLSLNVLPTGGGTSGTSSGTSTSSSSAAPSGTSTSSVAPAQSAKNVKTEVKKLINTGTAHKKSVSTAEAKSHSDLWEYIVKKYGRSVDSNTIKKIADTLGVAASKKPTEKQKKAILAALKKKGLKTGTQGLIEDQLAWLFENNSQEYVLRKSDGAIMQNMLTGDKVINPQGAENLYNFAKNPDQFLETRASLNVSAAGIEKLNRLIQQQSSQQARLAGNSGGDNADVLRKMDSMLQTMQTMAAGMVEAMQSMTVEMDSDAVIGKIRKKMNTENEMSTIRTTRGRLR